jgi:quinol monooxygenase YgiN
MASTRVRMTIEWSVPIGQTRPLTSALHSLAADVRPTRGCVSCSVSSDLANRSVVRYVEEWQTEGDLRDRVAGDTFGQLVTLMEDASQPPQIEFTLARGTKGVEFIEEARGARTHEQPHS